MENSRRNTMIITSKRRKYSLENILKRLDQNQVTFDLLEIKIVIRRTGAVIWLWNKSGSGRLAGKTRNVTWNLPWNGIWVNQTVLSYTARQVDKLENGSYEIYLKQKDFSILSILTILN